METGSNGMVNLLQETIVVYHSLIDVLEQEKESLIRSDVEALWRFSDRKHQYVSDIELLRRKMLAELKRLGVEHGMTAETFREERIFALLPDRRDRQIGNLQRALLAAKTRVHALSRANKNFVEEYLLVLDELIGIIANAGKPAVPYEKPRGPERRERANVLLHREA